MSKGTSFPTVHENESSAAVGSDLALLAITPFCVKSSISSVYCKQYLYASGSGVVMFQVQTPDT